MSLKLGIALETKWEPPGIRSEGSSLQLTGHRLFIPLVEITGGAWVAASAGAAPQQLPSSAAPAGSNAAGATLRCAPGLRLPHSRASPVPGSGAGHQGHPGPPLPGPAAATGAEPPPGAPSPVAATAWGSACALLSAAAAAAVAVAAAAAAAAAGGAAAAPGAGGRSSGRTASAAAAAPFAAAVGASAFKSDAADAGGGRAGWRTWGSFYSKYRRDRGGMNPWNAHDLHWVAGCLDLPFRNV